MKSGFVSIIGLPNAGKSTLLNAILGQKLSIITSKPQTTRKKILGIYTDDNHQIIFLDTPGILEPSYLLQKRMMNYVEQSLNESDIFVIIVDIASDPEGQKCLQNKFVASKVLTNSNPKILLLNKVDLSNQDAVNKLIVKFDALKIFHKVIPVSALLRFNCDFLLKELFQLLPEGPKYYPEEQITDQNERFFVSEIIREKILELYKEEIPYSCAVLIADFKEREDGKDYIQAEIVVERESQKGILIGKKGAALKKLGQIAREEIEEFLQRPVYLELRVKVRNKWRSNDNFLKAFGYPEE